MIMIRLFLLKIVLPLKNLIRRKNVNIMFKNRELAKIRIDYLLSDLGYQLALGILINTNAHVHLLSLLVDVPYVLALLTKQKTAHT